MIDRFLFDLNIGKIKICCNIDFNSFKNLSCLYICANYIKKGKNKKMRLTFSLNG